MTSFNVHFLQNGFPKVTTVDASDPDRARAEIRQVFGAVRIEKVKVNRESKCEQSASARDGSTV